MICNLAASFNRCLFKEMQKQLKAIWSESKDKSASKVTTTTDELQYFDASITQAVANTMEHQTDFVFVSMGNLTLARR